MPVKLDIKPNWDGKISKEIQAGFLEMAVDIHRRSTILAPRDTGALANSGKVIPTSDGFRITYGSSRVPYARLRHFVNRKNPQTLGYLAKAGDSVVRGNVAKYFRTKI